MKENAKKMAVLKQLHNENSPIALPDLLSKLPEEFKERSVRRWLDQLAQEGMVEKSGKKRGTKYFKQRDGGTVSPKKTLFDSYNPSVTSYLSAPLRTQLHQAGRRTSSKELPGAYAHRNVDRLLADFSQSFSQLEEKGRSDRIAEALYYLISLGPLLSLCAQTIRTLYYLLRFDHQVNMHLQHQMECISKKALDIADPFEQSLFLLVHLSKIDRRVARLSANIPLIIGNLVPLVLTNVTRKKYFLALQAADHNQDIEPIRELFVFSYMQTCATYDATAKSLGFDEIRVRYREERREIVRKVVLGAMVGQSMEVYIETEAGKAIPPHHMPGFVEDVREDLQQMDLERGSLLGITAKQLESWLFHSKHR